MLVLVLTLLVALVFSFLSLENSQPVSMQFAGYILEGIPLYMVILGSMIVGVVLSLLINLGQTITSTFMLFGKDQKIRSAEKDLERVEHQVNDLKVENAKLKNQKHEPVFRQSPFSKPNAFQRIRHRLSF